MSDLEALAKQVLQACEPLGVMVATAESCTGGMIVAALTSISGSAAVVDRGFVTYSNDAKIDMLGVRAETLDRHGAVSEETAREMAEGALRNSHARIAVSVTGIAGPTGGTPEKPVGLVWFGLARAGLATQTKRMTFGQEAGRAAIRLEAARTALTMVLTAAREGTVSIATETGNPAQTAGRP